MVARTIPKESSGTMIILRRLFDNFDCNELVVIGRSPYPPAMLKTDTELHYPAIEIPYPYQTRFRFWQLLSIPVGILMGLWTIWTKGIEVVVGIYPDRSSLTLAYFLSVLTAKPLLPYFCDLYAENQRTKWYSKWANWLQPQVFKRASVVLALTDGMKVFYEKQYGIHVSILPTAINGEFPVAVNLPPLGKPFVIGYSGSVVLDRLDPMQALVKAIGNNPDYELRIFSPQTKEFLQSNGIWADNVTQRFCTSQQELMEALSGCHLLYLPLTFKTGPGYNSIEQLSTCFGTKSYEYFLSARPILSHCPASYFTSTFFKDNSCGYTLDSNDPEIILRKLEAIQAEYNQKGGEFVKNALQIAEQFKGDGLAYKFTRQINDLL